jgi:hypothetical protein
MVPTTAHPAEVCRTIPAQRKAEGLRVVGGQRRLRGIAERGQLLAKIAAALSR